LANSCISQIKWKWGRGRGRWEDGGEPKIKKGYFRFFKPWLLLQWWWVFEFCLHYRDCQLISINPWFHYYRPGVCIFSKIIYFHQKLEVWREGKTFFFMVLFDRSGKLIISNGRLINIWEKVIKRLKNLPFEYKFLFFSPRS